ncbi:hypothetical protein K474DRAFT_1670784 [Panus rudis PR-1116 ss-1]|nr:hypothetical protein K474DRAFT_1670784 [Panus rudis PR-1116 ss-1]
MDMAEPDIKSVMSKLGGIATIWAAIRADTQAILKKLELANTTTAIGLYKSRVQTATDMYTTLQMIYTDYKDELEKSGLTSQRI